MLMALGDLIATLPIFERARLPYGGNSTLTLLAST